MKTRIFRVLVCMAVAFALLVNISPIRAEASAGTLLGSIAGVTSVNVPAGLVYGAAAIALGVAAGSNDDFRNMVDQAVSAGTEWVKDGTVELLRVVDEAGKAVYYAAGDMLENIRSWMFDAKAVSYGNRLVTNLQANEYIFAGGKLDSYYKDYTYLFPTNMDVLCVQAWAYREAPSTEHKIRLYNILFGEGQFYYKYKTGTYTSSTAKRSIQFDNGLHYVVTVSDFTVSAADWPAWSLRHSNFRQIDYYSDNLALARYIYSAPFVPKEIVSDYDLTIGSVSSVPIDGSSALDWAPEYQANRLYVTGGSNDPDPPDENNGKWFWPIALPLTAALLYAMSQADEWSGETPQEFDDYTQNTEFEILDRPEFDGYQGIEIAPVTNPNPNPDPGTDPDPTAPGEPNPDPDPEPDPDPVPDPSTDPGEDPDSNPDAGGNGSQNPENPPSVSDYTLDLKDFFPFCIPYDIYDLVRVLDAEPEAPHFVFDVDFPYMEEPWHIDVDFSSWDPVALVLRRLELLLFIVGLAMATRNYYIRG